MHNSIYFGRAVASKRNLINDIRASFVTEPNSAPSLHPFCLTGTIFDQIYEEELNSIEHSFEMEYNN
jgi:hypothetical protein